MKMFSHEARCLRQDVVCGVDFIQDLQLEQRCALPLDPSLQTAHTLARLELHRRLDPFVHWSLKSLRSVSLLDGRHDARQVTRDAQLDR